MDNLTKEQRRKNMQNIRSTNTIPEKKLAYALRKQGLYFARNVSVLTGKPDIIFRRKKVAVFVDSDFWHGNPKKLIQPQTNYSYWLQKIERNKQRDKEVNKLLKLQGWKVLRFWEHQIKNNQQKVVNKIQKSLAFSDE